MAMTSVKQYEMRVNGRLTKPHIYWHSGYKQYTWSVSGKVFIPKNSIWLLGEFCKHVNKVSSPLNLASHPY